MKTTKAQRDGDRTVQEALIKIGFSRLTLDLHDDLDEALALLNNVPHSAECHARQPHDPGDYMPQPRECTCIVKRIAAALALKETP